MAISIKLCIGVYALLIGLAAIQQWKEKGYHFRTLIFLLLSTSMLITICLPKKEWLLISLLVEFVSLHFVTVAEGLLTNKQLKSSHHIIRFIFHCIILLMVVKFINE